MKEKAFWAFHDLFYQLAEEYDADIEDYEYTDLDIAPNSIHKKKHEHKEAVRLLSKVLEDTELGVEELESWHKDYDDYNKWAGKHGKRNSYN